MGPSRWIGTDVCKVLGHSHTSSALRNHVDDEDKGVSEQHTPGGLQKVMVINEKGLNRLVSTLRRPELRAWQDKLYGEIIKEMN